MELQNSSDESQDVTTFSRTKEEDTVKPMEIPNTETKSNHSMKHVQEVTHFEPDEQMDPFRHWATKKPDVYSGFLYVAFRCNDEEASFYRANFKAANSTVFMDDNSSDDLVKIFARVLHPLLFRKDFFAEQNKRSSGVESHYVIPSFQRQEQQQLALRSLYALSSGQLMSTEEQLEISDASLASHDSIKRKAIECAKDLAKELLLSKKKMKQDAMNAAVVEIKKKKEKRNREEWCKLLSPIDENRQKLPPARKAVQMPNEREDSELQTQIPYMLGFLLLGATWVISN
jgi:hypothetical protein